jgi:glycine cleavage system T protein (aminomethyltransferase)
LHQSPMRQFHLDYGAQMVEYAGWEMPIRYTSIQEEHKQVRSSGGIFDVSHMGRIKFRGRHARKLLERLCTRKIYDMQIGQIRYSLMCNDAGGVLDDVLVYKLDEDEFLVVVNASNREKLLPHFDRVKAEGELSAKIEDETLKTAMVAIQGPNVIDMIATVSKEVPALKRYRFTIKNLMILKLMVSRTGYTGEDGVEVILPANAIGMAMKLLLKDVKPGDENAVIKPAGLGARDSLRLEAGMPLYGHELGEQINALSCGIDFAIALDKDEHEKGEVFVGMESLKRTRDAGGPDQKIVGLKVEGKRTPRQGMGVLLGDETVGAVTSGCMSPTLGHPIAMALVDRAATEAGGEAGTVLAIDTGRDRTAAMVVPLPFYAKPRKG